MKSDRTQRTIWKGKETGWIGRQFTITSEKNTGPNQSTPGESILDMLFFAIKITTNGLWNGNRVRKDGKNLHCD